MHPNNPYALKRPDFAALAKENPVLQPFLSHNGHEPSIDFTNPAALRALTASLLKADFNLDVKLRSDRLCPTIANRLDYILTCLELPSPHPLRVLDVGTGHVAIYPLLLHRLRPEAAVWGSEIDDVSLSHARGVVAANGIKTVPAGSTVVLPGERSGNEANEDPGTTASTSTLTSAGTPTTATGGITLLPALPDGSLLTHPIYPLRFTLCNPPFFASETEALASRAAKPVGTSAPTCSPNEEVTRGGEVSFVSRIIDESVAHGTQCTWYTSLVGKYASLAPLVLKLRGVCDNYALVRLQQARTVRWVLVWSFDCYRLSVKITRPHTLDPSTGYARLLPPPTSFAATTPMGEDALRAAVNGVLAEVGLPPLPAADPEPEPEPTDTDEDEDEDEETQLNEPASSENDEPKAGGNEPQAENEHKADSEENEPKAEEHGSEPASEINIAPHTNTWSRAARRAARSSDTPSGVPPADPLFRATLSTERTETASGAGSRLVLAWNWGADRAVVDAFWKFLVVKAGIRGEEGAGGKRPREGDGAQGDGGRGRGRGRGNRRGRGRGRGHAWGHAAPNPDAGWGDKSQQS